MAMMLGLFPAILMALGVVREKELGSIVNLYVTPVKRLEFLLGKQLPYVVVALANFTILFAMSQYVFGVPLKGSFPALLLGVGLFVTAMTAYGMLVSAFTRTQIAALFGTAILTGDSGDAVFGHDDAGFVACRSRLLDRERVPDVLLHSDQRRRLHQRSPFRGSRAKPRRSRVVHSNPDRPQHDAPEKTGALSMMQMVSNIFWLGLKELRSFFNDYVLLALVVYSFSLAIVMQARSNSEELYNASIAIVDEDHSALSRRIAGAFLRPLFQPAKYIQERDITPLMNRGAFTFIVDVPPHFERDALANRSPNLQIDVDATAMVQAELGSGYAQQILAAEIADYLSRAEGSATPRVNLVTRIAFNPNITTAWFTSVMGIINNITMLAIILAGAAVVREREHGTMDHLLVMPLTPFEIAMSKVWANGLVITAATGLSLFLVVRGLLHVPIAGSIPLFLGGVAIYLFFATAIGVFLGTVARSMPQLGLLFMLVFLPMNMLSGANTPLESMPPWLASTMRLSPSTHFVSFAQAILYRGAGLDVVWSEFLATAGIGALFFALAIRRFRKTAAQGS